MDAYEKKYNDLIARINAVKNTPKIGMKGKHHYDGYVETGIRDALDYIASLQQEQPEVDLEKFTEKIKTFQGRYKYPETLSIKGAMAFMARMFYQYPNVARQWYDSLPKATMD